MSFINDKTNEINCKIVYYGPPKSGKTTTLKSIYNEVKKDSKGEMISLSSANDRTLFFDFVPLNLGKIGKYTVRLHLYTVPGEVGYAEIRTLISKGIDGVVFVADSALQRMEENVNSIKSLKDILKQSVTDGDLVPIVFQYNKRDLPSAVSVSQLHEFLNISNVPEFETVATKDEGTFSTFVEISKLVLVRLKNSN